MPNQSVWRGTRVLVTGHTGFKGGWLSLWLKSLGADVHGLSLAPEGPRSFFEAIGLGNEITSHIVDIRDAQNLSEVVQDISPQIVFHLAAQSLVRTSYKEPLETFETNVMGTANLLEALRSVPDLRAAICVTTDKVYKNREWHWPYREDDPLGGKDAYSASKAAAEHIVYAYKKSFFSANPIPVLTARGGNVIGGGDWAEDRLIPDLYRTIGSNTVLKIRAPDSVRPWQHVLVLCHGYLCLAQQAMHSRIADSGAWNFGPEQRECVTVRTLLNMFAEVGANFDVTLDEGTNPAESKLLMLESSRARAALNWRPALDLTGAVKLTHQWYQAALDGDDLLDLTMRQIREYEHVARLDD